MPTDTPFVAMPSMGLAILPQPVSLTQQDGAFLLTSQTVILTNDHTQAIGRILAETLAPTLGFSLPVLAQAPSDQPTIILRLDKTLHHLGNEGYTLQATPQQITILGAAPAGVFYGTQTLRRLLPSDIFSPTPVSRSWPVPAVQIEDTPRRSRLAHRGQAVSKVNRGGRLP